MPSLSPIDGQISMENAIFFKNLVRQLLLGWVSDAKCMQDKNQHTQLHLAFTELSNSPGLKMVAFAMIIWNTTKQSHSHQELKNPRKYCTRAYLSGCNVALLL